MLLDDYLGQDTQYRRVLITSDAEKGNRLLNRYERSSGNIVRNVTVTTLKHTAELMYAHACAAAGYEAERTLISPDEAMMVFRSVLLKHTAELQYFTDQRMFNLRTAEEIYRKADLIRTNGLKQDTKAAGIMDLQILISAYEAELKHRGMMDETALYQYLTDRPDVCRETVTGTDYAVLQEDTDQLNGLQERFLKQCFGDGLKTVRLFEYDSASLEKRPEAGQIRFFKGYGSYNEAAYVADDIAVHHYPLGQVLILHMSESQVQPLQAALTANGMPARFLTPHAAKNDPYLSLMRNLLNWALDDYSEKALETIFAGSALNIEGVMDKEGSLKTGNLAEGSSYFDYVTAAAERYSETDRMLLGWGYSRNAAFIEHESAQEYHREPELLKFHRDLLCVFGNGAEAYTLVQPVTVYRNICSFLDRYTKPDPQKTAFLSVLKKTDLMVALEERALPLPEAIAFLEEVLTVIRVSDTESADAVSVRRLSGWIVPDRPYVYLIGLALKDMQGNVNESPVIRDDEMERFIGPGWKPTVRAQAELAEKNLFRTLKLFTGNRLSFGYASFDTVNIRAAGPSAFYRNLHAAFGCGDVPEFVYGNPAAGYRSAHPCTEEIAGAGSLPEKASASSAGELVKCPRQYWYRRILQIPENTFNENDPARWLQASDTGSFFHAAAERYVKQRLIRSGSEAYSTFADRDLLRVLFEELKDVYRLTAPADSEGLIDQETEELLDDAVRYFDDVHTSLSTGGDDFGWRILFAEEHFRRAPWTIDYAENRTHTFICSGTIDRIDYKVDEDANAVHLRIVDYKTGKQKNKQKEDQEAALLQHTMYYRALMDNKALGDNGETLLEHTKKRISELEGKDLSSMHYVFDGFRYEFPRDTERRYMIERSDLEGLNMTRLKMTMQEIERNHFYPNIFELYDLCRKDYTGSGDQAEQDVLEILEKLTEAILRKDEEPCRFCSYLKLCSRQGVNH